MSHIEPRARLEELDPGRDDAGYWEGFQARVMDEAAPRLVRRRNAAMTAGDVVLSWSRLLVPATIAAAAVAALVLIQAPMEADLPVAALEEILADPGDGEEPLPAFLHSGEVVDRNRVLLAVQDY